MKNKRVRVMVARFWHESNGFNPKSTSAGDFQICAGNSLVEIATASGSTLGGMITEFQRYDVDIIPSISVTAPPSGLVDHEFFEWVKSRLISDALENKPDAIALELHGAMGTTRLADAEGDLLKGLREAVGEVVPIGIGLDLHAHLTDAMIAPVDICIACKENPHSDVVECGEKVARCLLAVLGGELRPVNTLAKLPMILPGAAETANGPLLEIHEHARNAARADNSIWDISVFNVFRYVDDFDIGQAVIVLTNGDQESGLVAETIVKDFWLKRARFQDELVEIDEALALMAARQSRRPYVLADMGDRVLAGAPGDSTAILAAVLKRRDGLRGALPVTDPAGVKKAYECGRNSEITLAIGGSITPGFTPLSVTGRVVHLSDGQFVLDGPFQGGEPCSMGPTAVIEVDGRLSVILTTGSAFSHDPAVFTSQGIDIASLDFLVVKSGYHFKLNFAEQATPLLVRSPGIGYYTKRTLRYEKARFWPEHDIGEPSVKVTTYRDRHTLSPRADASGAVVTLDLRVPS
ncbi:M81 family metallopeptidase [Aquamicrobium sp. LC103]|uniref:M81 family metallopeptidase n=1 Tax=Aquamicrobium sp. LC103 TaxID=1120658 RepID=UPI000A52B60C|nr:M81 family metallopeptidase [Aquamicrobium sp. LC103]